MTEPQPQRKPNADANAHAAGAAGGAAGGAGADADGAGGAGGAWADKFTEKLHAKQQARLEARRDFNSYQEAVAKLFDRIATKVSAVPDINVSRPMGARTESFRDKVTGKVDNIKALTMSCDEKSLEFLPEGINFDFGKGRVRILHKIKDLPVFLYAYLVVDPASTAAYPGNLHWVIGEGGDEGQPDGFTSLSEERLEALLEAAFLAEDEA